MRKIITKAAAIRYTLYVVLGILILAVFPCRLFKENIESRGNEQPAGVVSVGGDQVVLQQFAAEYDHIDSIGFKLKGTYEGNKAVLRVFKESTGELLREIPTDVSVSDDYVFVYINLDTVVGDNYFYTIEGTEGAFDVLYEMTANSGTSNNGYMQYAGENKDAYNLVTRYIYRQPLRKVRSLLLIAAFIAAGVLGTIAVNVLSGHVSALSGLTNPADVIRVTVSPIVIALAVAAIITIGPLHMFSIYIVDIVVMILGVVILTAFILYMVNVWIRLPYEDGGPDFDQSSGTSKDHPEEAPFLGRLGHFALSVCIALALLACVHYMNGLYEIFHDIAWRRMVFFLGLGLILTFSKKELVNIYNPVLLIGGIITSRIYYVRNLPDMVDEYHVNAMFWTCMCIPVIYIMSAYIIRCLVRTVLKTVRKEWEIPRIHVLSGAGYFLYLAVSLFLVAGMITGRNTRYWPVMMAVTGGVYAVRLLFWSERTRFTDDLTRGILFHFAGCVIYCLMHRPYEAFEYVRFPLVFHTVTVTAEYMALVMAAAFVRLFSAYRKRRNIKSCLWEMFVFGCVSTYMLFTMSRTAMTGIVATGFVMWIAYGTGISKDSSGGRRGIPLITTAGMVVISMLLCFPVFFSAQKAIPALVGEPKLLEIERYPQTLLLSTDYQSEEYITFTRFTKAFVHKMFGMDEDRIRFDLYTINGKRTDIYRSHPSACVETEADPGKGVMLSRFEDRGVMYDGGFVPPHEYSEDGEPPSQWYDEDYWVFDENDGEWYFATWKIEEESSSDVTNGRLDIFRAYIEQLNDEGHEEMGALLSDGSIAAHAHNIYLQVAYDHGKIIGIVFAIWCLLSCVRALVIFIRHQDTDPAYGILPATAVTFAVCGITEWISHPCNPVGMVMLLVASLMIVPDKKQIPDIPS